MAVAAAALAIAGISLAATSGGAAPSRPLAESGSAAAQTTTASQAAETSVSARATPGHGTKAAAKQQPGSRAAATAITARTTQAGPTSAVQPQQPASSAQPPPAPQPSTAQPSTPQAPAPQPSTPQPSTPQPSAPQPSTAQPSTPSAPVFSFSGSGASEYACSVQGAVESGPSLTEVPDYVFDNESQYTIELYWITQQGALSLYATMAPGQSTGWKTYVGHYWLIANQSTQCEGVFLIRGAGEVYVT
jgi:hypothetical protein